MTTGVGVAVARVALAFTGSGRVVERAFACLAASTCARLNGGARAENRRLELRGEEPEGGENSQGK